jgi:hypothetical protein
MDAKKNAWERVCESCFFLRCVDTLLRGSGQVMFQDSAWCGLFFLLGIFWGAWAEGIPEVAVGAVIGLAVGTLAACLLGAPREDIRKGLHGYNGILVGCALPTFFGVNATCWVLVVVGAFFSTVIMMAVSRFFRTWKVSAMTAILKAMGEGGNGASGFMEDYTYHLIEGKEYSLGAHMLEVCPSLAADKPRIETHHLGIGMNEKDPARLVFEGKAGPAIVVSLIDMGGRLRLIVQDIECVKPILPMPNLPVARVMWRAMPDLTTGVECWITAGGAHHTVLSYDVSAEMMRDWARIMDIEFVHISKDTLPEKLEEELLVKDLIWKLR